MPESAGREPFSLVGLLAGATSSIGLGTAIVSIWGHDAQTTRMAALTLQEATGGRFTLGLGVSHLHLAQKLRGHVYERPLTHMREYLEAYRAGEVQGTDAGRDAGTDGHPRRAPRADADPGRHRRRWGVPVPGHHRAPGMDSGGARPCRHDGGPKTTRPVLAVSLPVVLETDPAAARSAARQYLLPYLRTPNYQAAWAEQGFEAADWEQPGSDRLVDAMVAWGDADALRARLGELLAAGADHVALIPLTPSGDTVDLPVLEALAG